MPKKRVFISGRILGEMKEYKEEAERAIEQAGMEPVYFDTADAGKRGSIKLGVNFLLQLIEAVKSSDAFVGLYGKTLKPNLKPQGQTKHSIELEYEAAQAARLPKFCYVTQTADGIDEDMLNFREQVMEEGAGFLGTPPALYHDLLEQLQILNPRIFISYSSKDQGFVNQLYERLVASGHRAWLNTESIPKGEHWHEEMVKALEETDLMILVLSPDATKSKWVKEEWKTFLTMQKTILPILHREGKVPRSLNALQMTKIDDKGEWYYYLLKSIEGRL
jgi:hypothetical protein